jgi:hypothetical protein
MKNLDLISKRITVIGITLCGVLLSASLLVFAIGSVTKGYATDAKSTYQNAPATNAAAGEIMMTPYVYTDNTLGILVWNSTTGKSQRYTLDNGAWVKKVNLPANPFE